MNNKRILLIVFIIIAISIFCYFFFHKKTENIILIENDTISLPLEASYSIRAMTYPSEEEITWENDSDIVTLYNDGTIDTLKTGETTVKLKIKNDSKVIKIIVTDKEEYADTFYIVDNKINLKIDESYLLQTKFSPENAIIRELTYESSNPSVATITDGYIKAHRTGTAQINVSMKINEREIIDSIIVTVGSPSSTKKVESISYESETLSLELNQNYQLNPIILPEDAIANIQYSSNNEDIVSVSEEGILTANAKGNTIIRTFSSDGAEVQLEVEVISNEDGITLNKDEILIARGETYQLKSNYVSGIEWYSSNNKVATINSDGIVRGITDGQAIITVINSYGRMNTVAVTVKGSGIVVNNLSLDVEEITIKSGNTYQLNAKISPNNATNKDIFWETADSRIVSVDDSGLVLGKMEGSTTIVGYSANNKSVTVKVNVIGNNVTIDSLDINPSTMTIIKGDTYQLSATLVPSNVSNANISWSSSNSSIVDVDENGTIKGLKTGSAVISATSNGLTSKATIYVTNNVIEVTSLQIVESSLSLKVGESSKITVNYSPANATNKNFKYVSSNPSIATVSNKGVVSALAVGSTTITVASTNGIESSIKINVEKSENIKITEVLINYDRLSLQEGETKQLKATILPLSANQSVTWVSGNESVVKVSSTGLITAMGPGNTVISAITQNGLVAKIDINVQYPPLPSTNTTFTMNSDSMKVALEKWSDFYITRIWLSNPGSQVHKVGGTSLKQVHAHLAGASAGNLNGIVVATNGSAFHSTKYDSDSKYNGTALGKLIITEGKVLRDDPNHDENTSGNKYYYYLLDANAKLTIGSSRGTAENHANIIKSAVNTFAFYPFFVNNGVDQPTWGTRSARRQAFCQINDNNYAIITTSMNGTLVGVANIVKYLGCRTAVNLDGGGSTTLILKNRGQAFPGTILYGNQRAVPDVLYFTEL